MDRPQNPALAHFQGQGLTNSSVVCSNTAGNAGAILPIHGSEFLISDFMGADVVKIYIGQDQVEFTVHKNLLLASGEFWKDVYDHVIPGKKLVVTENDPEVFKLFVEVLYSGQVPGFPRGMPELTVRRRLKNLCQLYSFMENFNLKSTIRNSVMDKIQDGFLLLNAFPEPPMVDQVYSHTRASSKLRKFCTAGLVFYLRSITVANFGVLSDLLNKNSEVMNDFLEATQKHRDSHDPRIRLRREDPDIPKDMIGVSPCLFHIHDPAPDDAKSKHSEGEINSVVNCYPKNEQV